MKNINMKKIVAGAGVFAVSALFAGAVAAANMADDTYTGIDNLTKDQLFGATGPAYNVIVGSMAQPVDVVWAGNIAAAIGKKAYTSGDAIAGAALESVTVTAGAESTSTISGDGLLTDDWELGSTSVTETLDDRDYSVLGDYDVDVDDSIFDTDEINVQESITITPTVAFDSDKDVADLTASFDRGDISYTLEFNPGINNGANDEGSPDFKFNLMGNEYTLEDYSNGIVTLVQNKNTAPYEEGASFEVDGYTITVEDILESSNNYSVELSISQNGAILASEVFTDYETVFNEYLESNVEIDTVYDKKVTVVSGTSTSIELESGQIIEDFPNIDDKLWKVSFTGSDPITKIVFTNEDQDVQWEDEDALKVDDSIVLPFDLGSIDFLGLTNESSKEVIVEDGYISYIDATDDDHKVFFYEEEDGTYGDGENYTTMQTLDDKKLYIEFHTADEDFNTTTDVGSYDSFIYGNEDSNVGGIPNAANDALDIGYFTVQLEDDDGDYLTKTSNVWTWETTNTDNSKFVYTDAAFTDLTIPLYNNESEKLAYGLYINEDGATGTNDITQFALGLKEGAAGSIEGTIDSPTQDWTIKNIYTQIDVAATSDGTYVGKTATGVLTDGTDMKSMFEFVVDDGQDSVVAHIDAGTGNLVDTDDSSYLAVVDQVLVVNGNSAFTTGDAVTYTLNQEDSDDLTWGYTEFGTYAEVDGGMFTAIVPDTKLYGQIFVGGGASTSTSINGSTFTLTAEGEQQTEDGVSVSLDAVALSGGAATDAIVPMTWNVATNKLVYLDNENPAGNKIIVGGHLVNTLAQNIGLDTMLTASGDYVLGQNAEGNIVVAGMTAEDTAMAAKELINVIENM
ncbi:MAG: hypothetical protein PHN22_00910 [Candidatus ainarchaeum sp.]|nr:hypothetical protein [Candidatus ainarchaeum sp.]